MTRPTSAQAGKCSVGNPFTSNANRPRLNAMASSIASCAGSVAINCGCPVLAGSAESARISLVVATDIGSETVDVPLRIKDTVPAERLQAIMNSVPAAEPNRATPPCWRGS